MARRISGVGLGDGVGAEVDDAVGHGRASIGRGAVASPGPMARPSPIRARSLTAPRDLARRVARGVRRRLPGHRGPRPTPTTARSPRPPIDGVRDRIRVPLAVAPPGRRLNLVIPALDAASTFGGIRTALDLLDALGEAAPRQRIDQSSTARTGRRRVLPGLDVIDPAVAATFDETAVERSIVSLADAAPDGLAVGPDDVFLATFWPTADWVRQVRAWQLETFGSVPGRFAYLIQDYEPGFYPRSAQSMLARATYDDPVATVAVFNTDLLRGAFEADGIAFEHAFSFEPRLAPALAAGPGGGADRARTRRLRRVRPAEQAAQRVPAHRRRAARLGGGVTGRRRGGRRRRPVKRTARRRPRG